MAEAESTVKMSLKEYVNCTVSNSDKNEIEISVTFLLNILKVQNL